MRGCRNTYSTDRVLQTQHDESEASQVIIPDTAANQAIAPPMAPPERIRVSPIPLFPIRP
jgi:hypothetical protein